MFRLFCISIFWITSAYAAEVVDSTVDSNGNVNVAPGAVSSGGLLKLLEKNQPEQLVLGNMSMPNQVQKDRGEIVQYICQTRDNSAGALLPAEQFCAKWASLEQKINAISRATGYPSAVMECTYLIESKFRGGLTSPAGARGISQFMPSTARDLCRSIQGSADLKQMFQNAEKACGGSEQTCNPASFLGQKNNLETQLLGTPMFYRHYYKAFEKTWANIIERDPKRATDFYHFLVIGYNAGPKVAEKFLHAVQNGSTDPLAGLPTETKKYTQSLDDCMTKPGTGVGRPGQRRSDCRNLQKGSHACAAG